MSYLDLNPHLIRQRNEEMLQEVQRLRMQERLRANRRPSPGLSHTNNLTRQSVLSLLRRVGLSE